MKKLFSFVAAFMLGAFIFTAVHAGEDVPEVLFQNYKACKPVPLPSAAIPDLTVEKAYSIQKAFVAKFIQNGDVVTGIKAGLTSPPAQKKFNAPGPVTGILFKSMQVTDGKVLSKSYVKPNLEVEIGYRLNQDVNAPTSPDSVKELIDEVMPAIEIGDVNFATFKGLLFTDIIADNVGPRGYILGNPQPMDKVDPNQVTGQLFMDGQALGKAVPGTAALGDQWKALSWSLNNVLANGGELKKGMFVITGVPGQNVSRKTGKLQSGLYGRSGRNIF